MNVVRPLEDQRITSIPSSVKFECEFSRAVPAVWSKKGRPISANEHYGISAEGTVHKLDVLNAVENDEGEYSITAKNATSTASLFVEGTSNTNFVKKFGKGLNIINQRKMFHY